MENERLTKKEQFKLDLFDYGKTLLISFIMVYFVLRFLCIPVQVQGTSMYPTLEDKSVGISNKIGYDVDGLKRFDIAIIHVDSGEKYLVKRVVGLPGETISYHDGNLYVNGNIVEEPFLDENYKKDYGLNFTSDIEEITLKEGEYYCLGDNRPFSKDSRSYGPFQASQVSSKGVFIFYPFDEFGVKSW